MKTSTAPVHVARTLADAVALRAEHPDATVLAGGTDVMVQMEAGTLSPRVVIDLWRCAELRGISDDGRRLGALTTFLDLQRHPAVPEALRECARTIGAVQIQARGTVGGNIVNASPAGDSLPLWLALDARFELAGPLGHREVAASEFWLAYRKTALAPDELLVAIHLPPLAGSLHYRKVGTRLAQAISKVVLGSRIVIADGIVTDARVALGSVGPVPLRARNVEAALIGRPVDPAAADAVAADIRPIDDIRSTALYRLKVSRNVIRGWLTCVAQGAGQV